MSKQRGFEVVSEQHRKTYSDVKANGKQHRIYAEITLPTRADALSAGYDFYSPVDVLIEPRQKKLIFTDVKAYMLDNEVLKVYIRSSLAVKQGLQLANQVGIIDASYYRNEGNDGNIGICLYNNSGQAVEIKAGERIAQGIFVHYFVIDAKEDFDGSERTGGFGSTGS
jgi:dUTP pyrophosphatase